MMEKIKVLVADDHPAFREGLCRLLKDETDLEVVAMPEDGEEAVESAKKLQPDVAIIDISMPKLNGIEAAKQMKSFFPRQAILMSVLTLIRVCIYLATGRAADTCMKNATSA
jgi:DNA-binding NarL/FixJ family response regulator